MCVGQSGREQAILGTNSFTFMKTLPESGFDMTVLRNFVVETASLQATSFENEQHR